MEIDGVPRDETIRDGTAPFMTVPLAPEEQPRPSAMPRLIYAALVLVPLALAAAVVLIRVGILAGRTSTARTPWDLAVIFLGILTALIMAFYVTRRAPRLLARTRTHGSDTHLATWELATLVATSPLAVLLSIVSFLWWAGAVPFLALPDDALTPLMLSAAAILVACAPMAYFDFLRSRHVRAIESRFPDLLRDLNESHASGMTMAQAIRVASRGDYGKLNPEIRMMARQISWGTSFPDALRMFSQRVGTPLVLRAVALINKATQAGGNVKDVLAAAARDAREIEALDRDRRSGMALYVIVIYVAFGVFLAVVAALQGMLVPSLLASTQGAGVANLGSLSVGGRLTLDDYRFIYFGVGTVQAIGSGIVAGVMSEGSVESGLKHSSILVAITIVTLGLLL